MNKRAISRRLFLKGTAAGLLVVVFVILSACSGNTSNGSSPESPPTSSSDANTSSEPAVSNSSTPSAADFVPVSRGGESPEFDEDKIILTFGALTDTHVVGENDNSLYTPAYFANALDFFSEWTDNGLDCLTISGDLTNYGTKREVENFAAILKEKMDLSDTPVVYCTGNHDMLAGEPISSVLREALGEENYAYDLDVEMKGYNSSRHTVINGIHFIQVNVSSYRASGRSYSTSLLEWLRVQLADAAADAPDMPIFVLSHLPVPDTVFGSNYASPSYPDLTWSSDEIVDILNDYPQAVLMTGHTHFSNYSESTIFQDAFTMINVGPLNYQVVEYGFYNLKEGESCVPKESAMHPLGMLMEVDANGTTRVTRFDFGLSEQVGNPWIINAPGYDDSLSTFSDLWTGVPGPAFETPDATLSAEEEDGQAHLTLNFTRASGNGARVYYYQIDMADDAGNLVFSEKFVTDFYRHTAEEDMDKEWVIDLGWYSKDSDYTVTLTPYNVWYTPGETQTVSLAG